MFFHLALLNTKLSYCLKGDYLYLGVKLARCICKT